MTTISAAFVFLAAGAGMARASDPDDLAPPAIIEKRAFLPHHEFRLAFAYLPQDPFWKAIGPDVAYIWHPNEYVSWEIARGAFFTTYNTTIRDKLRANFDKTEDPYEKASFIVASHVQFTPFYGRYSLMNRTTVHQETYFAAGVAMDGWTPPQDKKDAQGATGGVRPAGDLGLGFRWYTSRKTSLKLEVMENLFMKADGTLGDQVWLTFGLSYSVPR